MRRAVADREGGDDFFCGNMLPEDFEDCRIVKICLNPAREERDA
jgi:hypothetical protein